MSRTWRQLTADQRETLLALARADPERPWAAIARQLGLSRWVVYRYLRRHLTSRHPGPQARPPTPSAPPHDHTCPACHTPLPPIPPDVGYRCPCGQLIRERRTSPRHDASEVA